MGSEIMNRRVFLETSAVFLASRAAQAAPAPADWKRQVGLELYTVRDLTPKDYEGTLAKVAEIGYKEVEAATDYAKMEPKQFRAMLDRYGLTMPSTHVAATEGPDLEKQLEGFQIMGLKYTEIRAAGGGGGGGGRGQTEESVKRSAAQINAHGKIAKKFGMKMLIHNHTMEFAPIEGSSLRAVDIQLAETDPELVTLQLDVGWASVAGQNIVEIFKKHPGRFELWHVKDAKGVKMMTPQMTQQERQRAAFLVPVGTGE